MATYKKRGYKKSVEVVNEVEEVIEDINVEDSTTAEVFNTLEESANKSEEWIEKNSKPLLIGLVSVVVLIFGYLAYTQFVVAPKEKIASDALVYAQKDFNAATAQSVDSLYTVALEGQNGYYGLLEIADEYSGTKAGNLAKYYAGLSYLNTKQNDKAIEFLSEVSVKDELLKAVITGAQGDAYWAKNDLNKALDYFSDAAETTTNKAIAPVYLMKAGKVALSLEKYSEAEALFTAIKKDYPTTSQAKNIEKFINLAQK